jgi:hypothetical protein
MLLELLCNFLRSGSRVETSANRAIASDQELGEVPSDVLVARCVRIAVLEELVEIAGAVSVHLDLREHRKIDVELGPNEVQNLVVAARLLGAELVAWKAQDVEALGLVVSV